MNEKTLEIPLLKTDQRKDSDYNLKAHLLMLLSQLLFAGNYVYFRYFKLLENTSNNLDPSMNFCLLRSSLALLLIPILFFLHSFEKETQFNVNTENKNQNNCLALYNRRVYRFYRVPQDVVLPLFLQGVAGGLRQILVPIGLSFTTSTSASLVQPLVPLFTSLLSLFLGVEDFQNYKKVSVAIGCIGVLIASKGYDLGDFDFGFLVLLGVPITKALQVTNQKIVTKRMDEESIQLWQIILLYGVSTSFVLIYYRGNLLEIIIGISEMEISGYMACVYSVIFVIFISWRIQLFAVKELGPIAVSLYQVTQPIFCFVLGYLFLGERIQMHQLVGGVLIAVSLFVYIRKGFMS